MYAYLPTPLADSGDLILMPLAAIPCVSGWPEGLVEFRIGA